MTSQKGLHEMTPEELGKLFPIQVVPYSEHWVELFKSESVLIRQTLESGIALKIEHFGSTAVEGLSAKPTIDILVEIPPLTEALKEQIISKISTIGYQFIWRTDEKVPYMHFVKGYTPDGFRGDVFHIHMGDKNHALWDRIFFRDYLRQNRQVAAEYEILKESLAKKYKYDREAYTNAKSDFVKRITTLAKTEATDS